MSDNRKPDIRKWLVGGHGPSQSQPGEDAATPLHQPAKPGLGGRSIIRDVADRTSPRKTPSKAQAHTQPVSLADTRHLRADSSSWRIPQASRSTPGSPRPTSRDGMGTQDSRHSSPTRPSTPQQKERQRSGSSSPSRTLFPPEYSGSASGKRTANMAAFSPHKTKPRPKQAKTSTTPEALNSTPSFHSSPPGLSPSLSGQPAKHVFERDMEIKGSDEEDEGDLSDDSLPDIDTLVPPKLNLGSSTPLGESAKEGPISQKQKRPSTTAKYVPPSKSKPRFNIKALLDHQKLDDAINANFKKHEDADLENEEQSKGRGDGSITASPNTVRKQFIDMAGVRTETAGKALRAMERTEAASADRNRWYFFRPDYDPTGKQTAAPFPKKAAKGLWALLSKDGTRAQHIRSGSLGLWASRVRLPDDIFLWMLDAMAVEKSVSLLDKYQEIMSSSCKEQVQELVTPELLQQIYGRLGAAEDINDAQIWPVQEVEGGYGNRDWSALKTYLGWLDSVASSLNADALVYAVSSLLRMAADQALFVNVDVRERHQNSMVSLVDAVDEASWDSFCQQICDSLFTAFDQSLLRVAPLNCMASNTSDRRGRIFELRRRLAIAFFFDDPSLARRHPDQDDIIPDVIDRLTHDEGLKVQRRTNYAELGARIQLLDAAVDDGSFAPPTSGSREDLRDRESRFNADVDELADRLKKIWGSINDAGALYLSRTQAKNAVDCAQKRLTYSERTKPPPKKSIFDDVPGHDSRHALGPKGWRQQQENVSQKQKDFMHKFIGNLKKQPRRVEQLKTNGSATRSSSTEGTGDDEDESDDEDTFVTAAGGD